jgi:arylsulfatase A-like enzyme
LTDIPNIILVVLDTLRKDALGVYSGSSRTPFIDSFAKDAIVFGSCISPSPWTIPAHASLFTGLSSNEHQIDAGPETKCLALINAMNQLKTETLAEQLQRKYGYYTAGFSANYFIRPGTGFDRGFEDFDYTDVRGIDENERQEIENELKKQTADPWQLSRYIAKRGEFLKLARLYMNYRRIRKKQKSLNYPAEKGARTILKKIKSQMPLEEPFFLFTNFMELHEPYTKYELSHWNLSLEDLFGLKPIPPKVLAEIKYRYELATGQLDYTFGKLIQHLKDMGLYDDSLIIVTSDHGQAFRERNYYGHGLFLYDEIVELPLLMKFPRNRKLAAFNMEGYQTLTDVPKIVKEIIEDDMRPEMFTRRAVFSESFGIHQQFIPKSKEKEVYEVRRKAIFKDGYKLTYNFTHDCIEEFLFRKKSLDLDDHRHIVDALVSELKEGTTFRKNPMAESVFAKSEEIVILEKLRDLGYA